MSITTKRLVYRRRPEFSCRNCIHFEELPGRDGDGLCVRHAPQPLLHGDGTTDVFIPLWPKVYSDSWCGEFNHIEWNTRLYDLVDPDVTDQAAKPAADAS
jgi:hypothetical protein